MDIMGVSTYTQTVQTLPKCLEGHKGFSDKKLGDRGYVAQKELNEFFKGGSPEFEEWLKV